VARFFYALSRTTIAGVVVGVVLGVFFAAIMTRLVAMLVVRRRQVRPISFAGAAALLLATRWSHVPFRFGARQVSTRRSCSAAGVVRQTAGTDRECGPPAPISIL
jgi:predicted lysophospholipase L1 biosynthesis ABC-type transport system permease subunit